MNFAKARVIIFNKITGPCLVLGFCLQALAQGTPPARPMNPTTYRSAFDDRCYGFLNKIRSTIGEDLYEREFKKCQKELREGSYPAARADAISECYRTFSTESEAYDLGGVLSGIQRSYCVFEEEPLGAQIIEEYLVLCKRIANEYENGSVAKCMEQRPDKYELNMKAYGRKKAAESAPAATADDGEEEIAKDPAPPPPRQKDTNQGTGGSISEKCQTLNQQGKELWAARCKTQPALLSEYRSNFGYNNCVEHRAKRRGQPYIPNYINCPPDSRDADAEFADATPEEVDARLRQVQQICLSNQDRFNRSTYNRESESQEHYDNCMVYNQVAYDWDKEIKEANEKTGIEIESEYKTAFEQCSSERLVAEECCTAPDRCLAKPDGQNKDNENLFGMILQMGSGAALNAPSNSIKTQCERMSTMGNLMTGLNGYLAYQCGNYVGQCKKSCSQTLAELQNHDACKIRGAGICDELIAGFEVSIDDCKTFDNQSARLAQSAIASKTSANFAELCKKQVSTAQTPSTEQTAFAQNDCSSPATASTPFCQQLCSRAGSETNANCAGFFANQNGGSSALPGTADTGIGSSLSNMFSNLLDDEEAKQEAQFEDVEALANKSTGGDAAPGGGGGLGGGGDSGGYSGSSSGYNGAAEEGYGTNILSGTRSGNGYSASGRAPGSAGGSKDPFAAIRSRLSGDPDKGSQFNLKDFLPGGKGHRHSSFRGLASLAKDISPAHTNIFKKITDRYAQVCLRDALMDCPGGARSPAKRIGN